MRFFLFTTAALPFYSISVVMSIPQPFFFVKTNGKCLIFVLKYYSKVTIRYKISYSCNIAVIFTEKAEKIVENLSKYPYSLLIF